MSKFKRLLLALLALALMAPFAGAAPEVNIGGVGDLLLYPFFYADSATSTKIRVVNTSKEYGVVAKVVLRSSICSEELRDFLIYLSPNDVWTATITVQDGNVILKSTDDSVIYNGKPASEENPFVVSLKMPKNPDDTNQYGYIEVIAAAYVNYAWTDGTFNFRSLATLNGFDNLHSFMYALYKPTNPTSYDALAYCNSTALKGLIFPAGNGTLVYYPKCDNASESLSVDKNLLYGTAELLIPGGYAAYRAVAVDNFVTKLVFPGTAYKIPAAVDTPLNIAGEVDDLDDALLKSAMYIPYYDPDDADSFGSFVMLFFPTMQSKYDAKEGKCVASDYTSTGWKAVFNGTITTSINVVSFDNSEHGLACELSPCALKLYELYTVGPIEDIFDPFAFNEGWMKLIPTVGGSPNPIPVIPFAGFWNADGVTFIEPGYVAGSGIFD